jgi:SAM-dependent methyltransferase
MPDAIFEEPQLAALYDELHRDRRDLDAYLALARELGVRSVLDIGCGTGTFACLLAEQGFDVCAVDPAFASIEIARGKPNAHQVRWLIGTATSLPPLQVDLVTMTGNVAQVFLSDEEWTSTLVSVSDSLQPGGRLVFEVRDPTREGWKRWTREESFNHHVVPGLGGVQSWVELIDSTPPFVSFRWTFVFEADGAILTSDSTLRFRSPDEIEQSLETAGFVVQEVRDAPDRPGSELVFIAKWIS